MPPHCSISTVTNANSRHFCICTNMIYSSRIYEFSCHSPSTWIRICAKCSKVRWLVSRPPRHFLLISNIFPYLFAEDQQALEDEGIVIPMKSGLPSPPHRPFQHPMSIPPTMSYSPQFGQHSASSYQPYFMQPPPQQQLLAVTSMNAPSFPEPAVGPTAPQQRKKSIIESIVPVAVDNTKSMPEYMNAFPVNRRSSRSCMYIVCEANLCLCLYLYFVGGSAACSPIQTVR